MAHYEPFNSNKRSTVTHFHMSKALQISHLCEKKNMVIQTFSILNGPPKMRRERGVFSATAETHF